MTFSTKPRAFAHTSVATALLLAYGSQAWAVEFETENGWTGSVNTTLSLGASWRAENPDPKLYSAGDGALVGGLPTGSAGTNTDSGTLNWGKDDRFATPVKAVIDLAMRKGDLGLGPGRRLARFPRSGRLARAATFPREPHAM